MAEAIMEIKQLNKYFGTKQVLAPLDLTIEKGEVVAILGPSGSGKSTLLRCLNGLETITSGELFFKGEKLPLTDKSWQKMRTKIGMVFQSYDLFPNKTVLENIMIGPIKVQKRETEEVQEQALNWLERVGLKDRAHAYPRQLSGGQKQRVAIVRSLCMNPELILFDEVTASLDPENVREVLEVILELAKTNKTLVIVTHEMAFAKQVSDRTIFMAEGKILEQGPTKAFFEQPETERAAVFLRSLDFSNL
ncbi:amino acid ABC transporter ATP-binding protein [Enterococcus hailinensis]|uniref:amino acid ABC transporter ATP-binding protein n=1 Tax=Enterococcus hailinensis TaxID=3238988 RepID=UPI0038B2BEB3